MSINLLYERVGHLVRRLQQISVAIFLEEVGAVGITPVQFAALTAIHEHSRLDIQRLANLVAVDRATLGTVINRLVKSGLAEGCEDPFDRRSRVVRALSAGQKLLESVAPQVKKADLRLLKHLTNAEREVFMIYLRQLIHAGNDFSRVPLVMDANVDRNLSLYSRPGYLVRRLQQVCEGIFTDEVAELGLTPAQYAALAVIAHTEGTDNTRLANAIALDKVTTGSIVQRLNSRGLITVRSNAKDKRSKKLEITSDGTKLLRAIQPRIARADERVLSALTEPDRRQFMRLLDKVVESNNESSRAPLKGTLRKTSRPPSSQPA
jgi:DNA-binding MarR family transcriptional regulator